jgi:multidrug efflux system outer membrane protein
LVRVYGGELWVAILPLLLSAGCTVGPNYRTPQTSLPQTWAETSPAVTTEPTSVAQWWTLFGDEELNSLVDRAVRSNKDLQVAEARIRQARAQRRLVSAPALPSLNASGSYSRSKRSAGSSGFGAGGKIELFQAGLDASWEIDLFGGVRRAVEAANANLAASEENLNDVLVTLLGEVATNYIEVRGSQRRIAVAQENIETQRQTVEVAQGRFEAGLGTRLEVAQAQALLAQTESQIPALEIAVKQSIYQLGVLLGSEPESLVQELSTPGAIPPVPPEVPVGLPSELLRRRPDIRRAERQLAAATAQIGVATADLFPRLSLTGSYGRQSPKGSDLFSSGNDYWSYGPGLSWPIFAGGAVRANIEVQNALQEQALAAYESTVLTALQDAETSLATYDQSRQGQRSLSQAVDASRQAAQIARDLYQKGLTDFLNVLQSETTLYQAQDQLIQDQQQVSTALVAVFKALGGGWEVATEQAQETENK